MTVEELRQYFSEKAVTCVGHVVFEREPSRVKLLVNEELVENGTPLLGRMIAVPFKRNGKGAVALYVITGFTGYDEVAVINSDTNSMGAYRAAGSVKGLAEPDNVPWSSRDYVCLECQLVSAFEVEGDSGGITGAKRVPMDCAIRGGEKAYFAAGYLLDSMFDGVKKKHRLVYMGKTLDGLSVPLALTSFRDLKEAYHLLVVGATGAGKSTEVMKLLAGYAGVDVHRSNDAERMNFLVFDPQGEFTRAFLGIYDEGAHFPLHLGKVWKGFGKPEPEILGVSDILFTGWELFEEALYANRVFRALGVHDAKKQREATELVVRFLKNTVGRDGEAVHSEEVSKPPEDYFRGVTANGFSRFAEELYAGDEGKRRVTDFVMDEHSWNEFVSRWEEVWHRYFDRTRSKYTLKEVAEAVTREGNRTFVINLSDVSWNTLEKGFVLKHLVRALVREANDVYRERGPGAANCLVVLDEAHRLIPPQIGADYDPHMAELRKLLITALRETRKFGLGWLIISTSIASLDKETVRSTRVRIFGYGLNVGSDAEVFREVCGSEAYNSYRMLMTDPTDIMADREHRFMVMGPITLFTRNSPEFYISYGLDEFLAANSLPVEAMALAGAEPNSSTGETQDGAADDDKLFNELFPPEQGLYRPRINRKRKRKKQVE